MRRVLLIVSAMGLALLGARGASAGVGDEVWVVEIDGVVDPILADHVGEELAEAEREDVAAVVLTIDTPGGLVSSMREITQSILNSPVPVVTYVAPSGARAASAGTFILLAGSVAAMAPGTNVGAAHPVGVSGIVESEKATNDAAASIRSIAEARDRNADWAEEAVRESVSATAEEALELGVIDVIEPDLPTLLEGLDGLSVPVAGGSATLDIDGATIVERPLGFAGILHAVLSPDLAFLFFYAGIVLLVVEFITPTFGVAGVVGALLLAGAFIAFGMLPVQLLGILLLVASVVSFLLELHVPGVGIHTGVGVVTLVLGGLFLFDPSIPGVRVSPFVIAPVAIVSVAFFGFALTSAWRARKLPSAMGKEALVGKEGVAHTDLTPDGVVLVASEQWTAKAAQGPITKGEPIRVTGADGLRLVVEQLDAAVQEATAGDEHVPADAASGPHATSRKEE